MKSPQHSRRRVGLTAALGALCLLAALTSPAAAAPQTVTDTFIGAAITPAGQSSPVQIDPRDVSVRADGAIGLGYTYQASGQATGQLPGSFTYEEHGYLYFTNPADPSTMVGSQFSSGVFRLVPATGRTPIQIADAAPQAYTSGIRTLATKLAPRVLANLGRLLHESGPLTYGYFTFTDAQGTFTGYATPDFSRFIIQIAFAVA